MDLLNNTTNNGDPLANLRVQPERPQTTEEAGNQRLSQNDFFKLMTEQLANQDPTKPVDNDQMVAQMTNFAMAEGISDLNSKFENLSNSLTSNQALQASSLIGQDVLVPGNVDYMKNSGDGVSGVVIADQNVKKLSITVQNEAGEVVKVIDAGDQPQGNIQFSWDGKDSQGNLLPPGNYVVRAQGEIGGQSTDITTAINRQVGSVSLASSNQGIILNLDGDVSIKLDDVIQIGS